MEKLYFALLSAVILSNIITSTPSDFKKVEFSPILNQNSYSQIGYIGKDPRPKYDPTDEPKCPTDYKCGAFMGSKAAIVPSSMIYIKREETKTASCCINPNNNISADKVIMSVYNYNSTTNDISNTKVRDNSTVSVEIYGKEYTEFTLFCQDTNGSQLCARKVVVGDKPLELKNFKCVSYNWESLECTYDHPYNPAQVDDYILNCYKRYGDSGQLEECFGNEHFEHCKPNNCCKINSAVCWKWEGRYYDIAQQLTINITAENPLGSAEFEYNVDQYENMKPNPPTITIEDLSSTSIHLKWEYPTPLDVFPPGILTKIQFVAQDENIEYEVPIIFNRAETTIRNLYPYQNYEIQVTLRSAANQNFEDEFWWSEPSIEKFLTEAAVPINSPEVTEGCFTIESELVLYWKNVDPWMEFGPNFTYVVSTGDEIFYTQNNYLIIEEMTEPTITFEIRASNAIGISSKFSHVKVENNTMRPPTPIFKNIVILRKTSEVFLRWWIPYENGPKLFTIFWCKRKEENLCQGPLSWIKIENTTGTILSLQDLNIGTITELESIRFAVSAETSFAERIISSGMTWSECPEPKSYNQLLSPPELTLTDNKNATHVGLSWHLDCEHWRGIIKHIEIMYCKENYKYNTLCEDVTFIEVEPWKSNISIGPLKENTKYSVSLQIKYEEGLSDPSSAIIVSIDHGYSAINILVMTLIAIICVIILYLGCFVSYKKIKIFYLKVTNEPTVPLEKSLPRNTKNKYSKSKGEKKSTVIENISELVQNKNISHVLVDTDDNDSSVQLLNEHNSKNTKPKFKLFNALNMTSIKVEKMKPEEDTTVSETRTDTLVAEVKTAPLANYVTIDSMTRDGMKEEYTNNDINGLDEDLVVHKTNYVTIENINHFENKEEEQMCGNKVGSPDGNIAAKETMTLPLRNYVTFDSMKQEMQNEKEEITDNGIRIPDKNIVPGETMTFPFENYVTIENMMQKKKEEFTGIAKIDNGQHASVKLLRDCEITCDDNSMGDKNNHHYVPIYDIKQNQQDHALTINTLSYVSLDQINQSPEILQAIKFNNIPTYIRQTNTSSCVSRDEINQSSHVLQAMKSSNVPTNISETNTSSYVTLDELKRSPQDFQPIKPDDLHTKYVALDNMKIMSHVSRAGPSDVALSGYVPLENMDAISIETKAGNPLSNCGLLDSINQEIEGKKSEENNPNLLVQNDFKYQDLERILPIYVALDNICSILNPNKELDSNLDANDDLTNYIDKHQSIHMQTNNHATAVTDIKRCGIVNSNSNERPVNSVFMQKSIPNYVTVDEFNSNLQLFNNDEDARNSTTVNKSISDNMNNIHGNYIIYFTVDNLMYPQSSYYDKTKVSFINDGSDCQNIDLGSKVIYESNNTDNTPIIKHNGFNADFQIANSEQSKPNITSVTSSCRAEKNTDYVTLEDLNLNIEFAKFDKYTNNINIKNTDDLMNRLITKQNIDDIKYFKINDFKNLNEAHKGQDYVEIGDNLLLHCQKANISNKTIDTSKKPYISNDYTQLGIYVVNNEITNGKTTKL